MILIKRRSPASLAIVSVSLQCHYMNTRVVGVGMSLKVASMRAKFWPPQLPRNAKVMSLMKK